MESPGERKMKILLEQPFLAAPARACQDLNIQGNAVFWAVSLADALRHHAAFLGVPGGSRHNIRRSSPPCAYVPRGQSSINVTTKECVGIRTAREMRTLAEAIDSLLEGGQHEDGRPFDPAVQGGGDVRIRRVMVAPRATSS